MYRIAICDDDPASVAYLTALVREWAEKFTEAVTVRSFPSAEAFLFQYAEDKSFDILLLDIEMGEMDGVSLAKTVRRENREIQIIFVSGYSDYIAEGYDVEALHYLLKPVNYEKLAAVLDRALDKLRRNGRALLLDVGGEMVRIPLYQIRWLEVRHNYVTIHAQEDYSVKRTLGEMERELDDGFFRAGRSFIVNLRYIRRVARSEVELSDGERVPLSRGYYEPLNRALIDRL